MAAILMVTEEGLMAQKTAHALRQLGHRPILATDPRAARRELTPPPDLILLDMGLPDLPGEDFLHWLGTRRDLAQIPLLVLARSVDLATRRAQVSRRPPIILKNPAVTHELDRAVTAALAPLAEERRRALIRHLLTNGPHPLAAHVYLRLGADRRAVAADTDSEVLAWPEIGRWALLAGVLDREQAALLGSRAESGGTAARPDGVSQGS
jgi:DNA-binding response OmpR family regulator